jgi:putative transposase
MGKNRRSYSREFKIEAVALVTEDGLSTSQAARDLGISQTVLGRWKKQFEADPEQAFPGKGNLKPQDEELVGIWDGYRESEQSWKELLLDLKRRGLKIGPKLAIGDGGLGFWKALPQAYGQTRAQRCWVHKTANVLNKLPKGSQKQAKQRLHEIWMAETKKEAGKAFDYFLDAYKARYPKATGCLEKDRKELLAFYDFPAEHWKHIRTTNPIESTFATVRLRTNKTKNCMSRETVLTMVFRLCQCAENKWRKLDGSKHLAEVIKDVRFVDGIREQRKAA